jgi:hypothetical protein
MCGIYGWQLKQEAKLSTERRTAVAVTLGLNNDKRGGDSWGWYAPNDGAYKRGLGDVTYVARKGARYTSLIAHTRFGTHGSKSVDNAHPFRIGGLVGAHNGIIYNHMELNRKYGRKFDVDSQHIFAHLTEKLPLSELEGYGTVEYVKEDQPESIWLAKLTDSGQLTIIGTEFGVFWSSEASHLTAALKAGGITKHTDYALEHGKLYEVVGGELFIHSKTDVAITPNKVDKRTQGSTSYFSTGGGIEKWSAWGDGGWEAHAEESEKDEPKTMKELFDEPYDPEVDLLPHEYEELMELDSMPIQAMTEEQYIKWHRLQYGEPPDDAAQWYGDSKDSNTLASFKMEAA